MNVARIASLRAGLPVEISGDDHQSLLLLRSPSHRASRPNAFTAGQADVIVAGGAESMSLVPMGGNKVSPNPWLMDNYPDALSRHGPHRGKSGQEVRHHPRASR